MQGVKDMSLKKQGDDCMVSRSKIRVGDSLYGLYVRYVPYKATQPDSQNDQKTILFVSVMLLIQSKQPLSKSCLFASKRSS